MLSVRGGGLTFSLFGPDKDRLPTKEDLIALPSQWMASACMDGSFRRLTGWLGLAPAPSAPKAFTCRLKTRLGVFGLYPLEAEEENAATFQILYFPTPQDPVIEQVALEIAVATIEPDYNEKLRDFPNVPAYLSLFAIGEMRVACTGPAPSLKLSLTAQTVRRLHAPNGVPALDGTWLVPPGGLEEDFPAFDLAQEVFAVFAAGLSAVLKRAPENLVVIDAPTTERTRRDKNHSEDKPSEEAKLRTHILAWGQNALSEGVSVLGLEKEPAYRIVRVVSGLEAPNEAEKLVAKRPRLIVVSGFLGAGKTSFLNQFIEFYLSHDRLIGVIQNEIGAVGVDAHLLEGEESVLALDAGCVCCTLAGSLTKGIRQLTESLNPETILLETTGLANPFNMIGEMKHLDDLAELAAVVTVVDAERFFETLEDSALATDQIRAADFVVLNKCDLIASEKREAIERKIQEVNPEAKIIPATFGRVNPSLFAECFSRHAAPVPCCCGCGEKTEGPTHIEEKFVAIKLDLADRLDRAGLLQTLQKTPKNVVRIKGLAHFEGEPNPEVIQFVPGHAACEASAKKQKQDPFLLIIGRALDETELRKLWAPFLKDEKR